MKSEHKQLIIKFRQKSETLEVDYLLYNKYLSPQNSVIEINNKFEEIQKMLVKY